MSGYVILTNQHPQHFSTDLKFFVLFLILLLHIFPVITSGHLDTDLRSGLKFGFVFNAKAFLTVFFSPRKGLALAFNV